MKILLIVLLTITIGQTQYRKASAATSSSGIDWNANVNDTGSFNLIDMQNKYNNASYLFDMVKEVEKNISDEIWYEAHIGITDLYNTDLNDDIKSFTLGFRLNLNNPKLPQNGQILAQINEIKNRSKLYNYEFGVRLNQKVDSMTSLINQYNEKFWFKRYSIGVMFPFQHLSTSSHSGDRLERWDFKKTSGYVGVDFGDRISFNMGYSIDHEIIAGFSIDVSTPLYNFSSSFINLVTSTSSMPGIRQTNIR